MAILQQNARISHHAFTTTGLIPTIPVSTDHTDQTWIATDIYLGELSMNIQDDRIWMRTINGIVELLSIASPNNCWIRVGNNIVSIRINATAPMILPETTDVSDLGSASKRWKDLYLGSVVDFSSTLAFNKAGTGLAYLSSGNIIMATDDVNSMADVYMNLATADASLGIINGASASARLVAQSTSEITVNTYNNDSDLSGTSAVNFITLNQAGEYVFLKGNDRRHRMITQPAALECDTHTGQKDVTTSGLGLTTIHTIPLYAGKMMSVKVRINGYDGAAECCGATGFAVFNGLTQIGTTTIDVKSTTAQTISISASGSNALIQVNGKSATTMAWVVDYEWSYLHYNFGS